MFDKINWFIAYKYLLSKQDNKFISFISLVSIIGVTLGIAVLIIVTSVLNGFQQHIESKAFDNQYHMVINLHDNNEIDLDELVSKIKSSDSEITEAYPLIIENALVSYSNVAIPAIIGSLYTKDAEDSSRIDKNISVSTAFAEKLNLSSNDKLILASSHIKNSVLGPQPSFKKFNIFNIISNDEQKYYNLVDIIMPYKTVQKFYKLDSNYISGIYLYLKNPLKVSNVKSNLLKNLDFLEPESVITWHDNNQTLFQAIKLERISIILLLIMIVAIACFNILSGLYIQVSEKNREIAILRTIGLRTSNANYIFIIQGLLVASIGTLAGVLLGGIITSNLPIIITSLQQWNVLSIYNNFYNAIAHNDISISLNILEITILATLTLLLCAIAALVPARKSSKINIIEVLKDE